MISSFAGFDRALQVALSVDRRVFAAEMDDAFWLSFYPGEAGVLTDLPTAAESNLRLGECL
jgi:hypothetical protein